MAPTGYKCVICGGAKWDSNNCAYSRYIKFMLNKYHNFTQDDFSTITYIFDKIDHNIDIERLIQTWYYTNKLIRINNLRDLIQSVTSHLTLSESQINILYNYFTTIFNFGYHFESPDLLLFNKFHSFNCKCTQECYENNIIIGKHNENDDGTSHILYTKGTYSFYGNEYNIINDDVNCSNNFNIKLRDLFRINNILAWPKNWSSHDLMEGPIIFDEVYLEEPIIFDEVYLKEPIIFDEVYCHTCWESHFAKTKQECIEYQKYKLIDNDKFIKIFKN